MSENIQKYKNTLVLTRIQNLEYALEQISDSSGLYLEFGVHRGVSINHIANHVKPKIVYGFDSFEGLPEDWERGSSVYKKGHFDLEGSLPDVVNNVELIKGFFENTLEPWVKHHNKNISFLHIDCDLYSATRFVLKTLNHLISPGTIIVFDELCDWKESGIYPAWEEGEWKALNEWLEECDRELIVISRGENFESTVRVIR